MTSIEILDGLDDNFSLCGIEGILKEQSDVICCTQNGIAKGQWQDTDFPIIGDVIGQVDIENEDIPQMDGTLLRKSRFTDCQYIVFRGIEITEHIDIS